MLNRTTYLICVTLNHPATCAVPPSKATHTSHNAACARHAGGGFARDDGDRDGCDDGSERDDGDERDGGGALGGDDPN